MSTEELLKPRYKVIADFPGSPFKVGDIWNRESFLVNPDQYPHLFKKLEWWEERKVEDMPEFLKDEHGVFKIREYHENKCFLVMIGQWVNLKYRSLLPATEQEYLTYQQSKQSKQSI